MLFTLIVSSSVAVALQSVRYNCVHKVILHQRKKRKCLPHFKTLLQQCLALALHKHTLIHTVHLWWTSEASRMVKCLAQGHDSGITSATFVPVSQHFQLLWDKSEPIKLFHCKCLWEAEIKTNCLAMLVHIFYCNYLVSASPKPDVICVEFSLRFMLRHRTSCTDSEAGVAMAWSVEG